MYYYPVIPYMYPYDPYADYRLYHEQHVVAPTPTPNPYDYSEEISETEEREERVRLEDHGPRPYVVNIREAARQNRNYRTALWTGRHLQVTVMDIRPGEDIGLEVHPHGDQFVRLEEGRGVVEMGRERRNLNFRRAIRKDDAVMIPAGMWHNITNTGNTSLKLYTIYAPPEHRHGTVHRTKRDAQAGGHQHGHHHHH